MSPNALQAQLQVIAGDCDGGNHAALQPLIQQLQTRYGSNLVAILYYGSCWRSGDVYNGLNDFYVIVERLRLAHSNPLGMLGNGLLPPNVYYLECAGEAGTLRAKYALLSQAQLQAGAQRWFNPCIWGRFAQPVGIVHAHSPALRLQVQAALGQCVVSLLQRALPALPNTLDAADACAQALALSYRSELRVERKSHSHQLITGQQAEYARRAQAAAALLGFPVQLQGEQLHTQIPSWRRMQARISWPLRSLQGKLLSILRLAKACFTFRDAIDYGLWKLQRHTGVEITATDRLRRHPLIFVWPLLWRLYRQGALR